MTEPSELRGAITKEEAGEVAVVLSDEIYRLSSAAQMGYEQSDAEFFAPRAERLDRRAEYLRSIRSKLLAPSFPEPPNDAEEFQMVPDGRKATAREWLAWVPSALRMIEAANREIDDLNEQLNDIAHLVPEEFETDIAQTAIITNYIEHLQALSSAPTGLTELFLENRIAEIDREWNDYLNAHPAQRLSSRDDIPCAVFRARIYELTAILESSSAPTPEME